MAFDPISALIGLGTSIFNSGQQKKQAQAQRDAMNQAAAREQALSQQQLDYYRQADAEERKFQQQAIDLQNQMFQQELASGKSYQQAQADAIAKAQQMGLNTAGLGMAGDIAQSQMGLNTQLGLMGMQQQENLPQRQAQLSSLQALPYLQALLGLPAYAIPTTLQQGNPQSLAQDVLGNVMGTNQALQPMLKDIARGGQGQPGATPSLASMVGQGCAPASATTSTQLTPANINLSPLMAESPLYKLQQDLLEKSILRNAAANGGLSSTQTQFALSDANRRLAAEQADKLVSRLSQVAGMGMGAPPSNIGSQFSSALAGSLSNLGSIGQNFGGLAELALKVPDNRTPLYGQYSQNMGNLLTGIGNSRAQNLGNMGNALLNSGQIGNTLTTRAATTPQPNWFSSFGPQTLNDIYSWYKSNNTFSPSTLGNSPAISIGQQAGQNAGSLRNQWGGY